MFLVTTEKSPKKTTQFLFALQDTDVDLESLLFAKYQDPSVSVRFAFSDVVRNFLKKIEFSFHFDSCSIFLLFLDVN